MRKNTFLFFAILFVILNDNNFAYSLTQNNSSSNLNSLKETIIALDVTRIKSQQELSTLNNTQNTSLTKEINEYTVFINYLSYQIKNYCLQIKKNYGSEALTDIPCISMNTYNQGSVVDNTIQTSQEKIEFLDDELLNSLGDFDEMLLKEEELIASKTTSNKQSKSSNASGSSGVGRGLNTKEDYKNTNNNQKTSTKDIENNKGLSSGGNQRKYSKEKINRRRTLDEIDDDIVARQLKEAAEKETNPDLKDKLWEEYYKYKQKTFSN